LTSGFYDLGKEVSVSKVYYGDDVSKYAERSSLPGSVTTSVPLLVTDAELDPEMFKTETKKLVDARNAAGKTTSHRRDPRSSLLPLHGS
jgi:triacylglycerol lipase